MNTRRWLIFLPLMVMAVLVQSFFWVPTYDKQTAGNPQRLTKFIESSGGDARLLNPILHSDTASGNIVEKVFDGLLDYDDQLKLRPRLAESWTEYEEAYLVLPPDGQAGYPEDPEGWRKWIDKYIQAPDGWKENIRTIEMVPERESTGSLEIPLDEKGKGGKENGRPKMQVLEYQVRIPKRLKFTLKKVDQYFFDPLFQVLGKDYADRFPYARYITPKNSSQTKLLAAHYRGILKMSMHHPVLIFKLRKGVQFHDGHEFDSGDVLFTYQAIMNPSNASPRTSDYEPVLSAEVLGPHEIKFVYKRLFSPAINAWMMGMLPEHLLNDRVLQQEARSKGLDGEAIKSFSLRDSDFNRHPVGTGPFVFKEWQSDQFIRLLRNEHYWDGPPEYREFVMRIIADSLTQEMEFYTGAADNYSALPHQVARLKEEPQYQNFSTVQTVYSYIGYNLRNPLFQSAEVRRALGMAIDVEKIIEYVLYNEGERVTGPFAKITDWYDHSVPPVPYDPEGALKILSAQGWQKNPEGWLEKDGKVFEFNLITNSGNPIGESILAIVQNYWRKVGIRCHTLKFEWAVFLKDFVNSLKFDALVLGWSMGIDPDLYQLWHSSQTGPNQLNFVGYESAEADRLIVAIRQEYDRKRQMELTHQLHRLIARDQPYTFLYVNKSTRLLDRKIVIVERRPDGSEQYKKIYPVKGGNIHYYFNRWRKLQEAPHFAP